MDAANVSRNVCKTQTGGLNIDACRLDLGRWPPNVLLLGGAVIQDVDAQGERMGVHPAGSAKEGDRDLSYGDQGIFPGFYGAAYRIGDDGGASRFFWVCK